MSIATNTANDAIQQLISCLISSVAPAYDLIFHRQCMAMYDMRTSKRDG